MTFILPSFFRWNLFMLLKTVLCFPEDLMTSTFFIFLVDFRESTSFMERKSNWKAIPNMSLGEAIDLVSICKGYEEKQETFVISLSIDLWTFRQKGKKPLKIVSQETTRNESYDQSLKRQVYFFLTLRSNSSHPLEVLWESHVSCLSSIKCFTFVVWKRGGWQQLLYLQLL
jgi:hypothetical protein